MCHGEENSKEAALSQRLGRVILLSGSILSPFILSYSIWYWLEYRAVHTRIDALHAAGELIDPHDFVHPIDAENNGAKDVSAAATILDDNAEEYRAISWVPTTRTTPPEAWPYLEAAVRWYEPALRRMDHAITKGNCEWDHSIRSPVLNSLSLHELTECDSVGLLLISSALVEHHHQQDELAFKHLGEMLYLSGAEEHSPSGVGHLRAGWMTAAFVGRLEQLLPVVEITSTESNAVRPAELRSLIRTLCDESGTDAGLRFGLASDRMAVCDLYGSEMTQEPLYGYMAGPFVLHSVRTKLDEQTSLSSAVISSTNFAAANQKLSRLVVGADEIDRVALREQFQRFARAHFIRLADRRIAAVALAIRFYRFEHADAFPATLNALVPNYLPSIPLDPMAGVPTPLHYIAAGTDPVIYSVGDNDKDDGGSEAAEPGQYGELDEWQRLDRVFHLTDKVRPYLDIPGPPSPNGIPPLRIGIWPIPVAPWDKSAATLPVR